MSFTIIRSLVAIVSLTTISTTAFGQATANPDLVKVQLDTGSSLVGEFRGETDDSIKIFDLRSGNLTTLPKAHVFRLTRDINDREAIATVGLGPFLAWKIERVVGTPTAGKVIKIAPPVFYVTLGSKTGARRGQKLVVFRDEGDLIDPDTGKVIGKERPKLEISK